MASLAELLSAITLQNAQKRGSLAARPRMSVPSAVAQPRMSTPTVIDGGHVGRKLWGPGGEWDEETIKLKEYQKSVMDADESLRRAKAAEAWQNVNEADSLSPWKQQAEIERVKNLVKQGYGLDIDNETALKIMDYKVSSARSNAIQDASNADFTVQNNPLKLREQGANTILAEESVPLKLQRLDAEALGAGNDALFAGARAREAGVHADTAEITAPALREKPFAELQGIQDTNQIRLDKGGLEIAGLELDNLLKTGKISQQDYDTLKAQANAEEARSNAFVARLTEAARIADPTLKNNLTIAQTNKENAETFKQENLGWEARSKSLIANLDLQDKMRVMSPNDAYRLTYVSGFNPESSDGIVMRKMLQGKTPDQAKDMLTSMDKISSAQANLGLADVRKSEVRVNNARLPVLGAQARAANRTAQSPIMPTVPLTLNGKTVQVPANVAVNYLKSKEPKAETPTQEHDKYTEMLNSWGVASMMNDKKIEKLQWDTPDDTVKKIHAYEKARGLKQTPIDNPPVIKLPNEKEVSEGGIWWAKNKGQGDYIKLAIKMVSGGASAWDIQRAMMENNIDAKTAYDTAIAATKGQ